MPNKLKSGKQFRLMEGIAHGMKAAAGPSPKVAKEMLGKESFAKKSKLAKMK